MRPYLAIIKDSFREAFVSRVLWIVLILLLLVLLLVFPLSYSFSLTTEVSNQDILKPEDLIAELVREIDKHDKGEEPGDRLRSEVAQLLEGELRTEITESAQSDAEAENQPGNTEAKADKKRPRGRFEESRDRITLARKTINELIVNHDLSKLASLDSQSLYPEARALIEARELSELESQRLNRLILEFVFEDALRSGPATSIVFSYLGMEIPGKFPIEKERLFYIVRAFIKYGLNFVFNTVGILMALIITSNIIPQTFDPGSLNLLLSKPISRWKLFVAQFLGGCAFVTLTMSFFFAGVWLYLGSRLGYWNVRLLFYIPSFIGIFAIYYSASAVAGLIWRSSIVSVVAGAGLWVLTFVMFTVNTFCETAFNSVAFKNLDVFQGQRFVSYVPDHREQISQWNVDSEDWEDISDGVPRQFGMVLGPLYDSQTKLVFGTKQNMVFRPFGPPVGGKMELLVRNAVERKTDVDEESAGRFETQDLGLSSIRGLFRRQDGRVLVLAGGQLHLIEFNPDFKEDDPPANPGQNEKQESDEKSGPERFLAKSLGPQRSIRTGGTNTSIALNPATADLAVMKRGKLSIYSPNQSGQYEQTGEHEFEQFRNGELMIAFGGNVILVFHAKTGAATIDARTLKVTQTLGDKADFIPVSVKSSPDGRFIAALRKNETVWNYEVESGEFNRLSVSRDVKAIAFDHQSHLHVGDRWLKVIEVDLEQGVSRGSFQGALTSFQTVYKGIIYPLYFMFPKCGELNYTVEYLITGSDTADTLGTTILKILNVDRMIPVPLETYNLQPWPQVWNALIFIFVMLGIGCVIIERTDY